MYTNERAKGYKNWCESENWGERLQPPTRSTEYDLFQAKPFDRPHVADGGRRPETADKREQKRGPNSPHHLNFSETLKNSGTIGAYHPSAT